MYSSKHSKKVVRIPWKNKHCLRKQCSTKRNETRERRQFSFLCLHEKKRFHGMLTSGTSSLMKSIYVSGEFSGKEGTFHFYRLDSPRFSTCCAIKCKSDHDHYTGLREVGLKKILSIFVWHNLPFPSGCYCGQNIMSKFLQAGLSFGRTILMTSKMAFLNCRVIWAIYIEIRNLNDISMFLLTCLFSPWASQEVEIQNRIHEKISTLCTVIGKLKIQLQRK